jgi:hypothetical protein
VKEYIRNGIRSLDDPLAARAWVREYLQARILSSLQDAGAMANIAFHGGTCLRFLFSIPRSSEDLDFALERNAAPYDFRALVSRIERDFSAEAYVVDARVRDEQAVHSAFIRFPGLLHELGLSTERTEVTAIKVEIDTRPPAGAQCATTLVRRHVALNLFHHDRASLLAGKLHAILQRPYVKGRYLYDLFWYLGDRSWPGPNLDMLSNALEQSGWRGPRPASDNWRNLVASRLADVDWKAVVADVQPFLERQTDLKLLTRENLSRLLINPSADAR